MATLSRSAEDYLKCIYKLARSSTLVTTSSIAAGMAVSMASATNMVKRLAQLRLVEHAPYQGVILTDRGRRVALEVIRHHRLLELFLSEHLGFDLDRVDDEAERLEHVLSEELEARIDRLLGHPTLDPHGHPIPTREGRVEEIDYPTLAELEPGTVGLIRRVSDSRADHLRVLAAAGLVPGARIMIVARDPGSDATDLVVGDRPVRIDRDLEPALSVEPRPAED